MEREGVEMEGREVGRKGMVTEAKRIWKMESGWKEIEKEIEKGEREKGKGWIGRKGDKEGRERRREETKKN